MAKKNNSARKHSSPGLYFTDTVVNYATKSLGITSLGVVGETLRGRAFEPTTINDWGEFIYNFGGTNTEKFRGSQYPKYELPYIAQSYLEQSHNLKVVRVLGLSGVNAGPAWVVTAHCPTGKTTYENMVVLVIRSRGEHQKAVFVREKDPSIGICEDEYEYDGILYYAKEVVLQPSKTLNLDGNCTPAYITNEVGREGGYYTSTSTNYGTFTLHVTCWDDTEKDYSVTLNPSDKNYIYNVIGGDPEKGDAEIYVEELYDVALRQLVNESEIDGLNGNVVTYENVNIVPAYEDVYDILTDPIPTRNMLGKRYLYSSSESVNNGMPINVRVKTNNIWGPEQEGANGVIYTVYFEVNPETGERSYFYGMVDDSGEIAYEYMELSGADLAAAENTKFYVSGNATAQTPQSVYNDVPTATSLTPDLIATNMANSKVLKEEQADSIGNGVSHLRDFTNLETFDDSNVIVIEPSDDGTPNFDYNVKYKNNIITSGSVTSTRPVEIKVSTTRISDYSDSGGHGQRDYQSQYLTVEYPDKQIYKKISNVPRTITGSVEALTPYTYAQVDENNKFTNCVYVSSEKSFYINMTDVTTNPNTYDVKPITLDFNNYKEQYRWAMSPWIVSEMKGSAENVELNKLFRFHSISDGSNATTEFKVSIENIDPSTGKFDVVVRDFYDSDLSVNAYEKFTSCDLVPGSPNYISLKIGSTDGMYNSKSRYITVEVIENDVTKNSIPAGFLGYPTRDYTGLAITENQQQLKAPYFRFNRNVDDEIKAKKQYFGVSDLVGVDEDIFKYKGVEAYDEKPEGLTPCFHLDARIQNGTPNSNGEILIDGTSDMQVVSVDGITGYSWVTVGKNNTLGSNGIEPRIGDEATMIGTIYEDKAYRKFTVAMYGGWDGWDYYRTIRSNGDEYRYKEYKGAISPASGYGTMFNIYREPEALGFSSGDHVITSDYYAYLAGVKLLGNPKSVTVNVLATPGIDYVNNKALVDEVIDVVEDDRGDLIYVITTPDKPSGAGDTVDEMYTAEDAVYNLEDSDIDSNHCCTYYPWVKYYDSDNYQYVYLPLTRDVVRSIAYTDNVKFSWYANAGWNRGNIPDNAQPKKKLTLNEQDTLYDGRINFVNSFAEEGNKIWGDKNLQIDDNLLNRISKRRLLLRIRTMLQNACIGLIFDPNDMMMSQTVRSAVAKVLDDVKMGRGITDYKIEIDDSPETRDQLGLNVTYHIKPIQALEWINFTSVLTPEGMDWM